MCENEKITEQVGRKRLEFGAVPLQPWSAPYPGVTGENYAQASVRHIRERLDTNIHIPIENGSIGSNEELQKIYGFCDISLTDAHMRRITHHYEHSTDENIKGKIIEGNPEVVEAVHSGTATPSEMLETLVVNPHLGAIELAKLSHPFDSHGDKAMLEAVYEALRKIDANMTPAPIYRHKVKRVDTDIPAMTVLEKRLLASINVADEYIDVIVRKSLLVRGNPGAIEGESAPRIDRLIKNITREDAQDALFGHVLDASRTPEALDSTPWLDILTTSVYACYRTSST